MPGIDLNLDLPTLADPLNTIVSKLVSALSLIEEDLAAKVTAGEIDINTAISANGQRIRNVGGLQLAGGLSTELGTLYMDGSDLWVRTASGAVKLTAAGQVNITGSGGIGGDYASPALVSYDLASQEYRFFAAAGVYADVVADDLVLKEGASGSVRFAVDPAITTARSVIIKTLASSGISCVVYNAATSTIEDAATSRITNDVKVTTLGASGNVTLTGALSTLKHGDQSASQGFDNDVLVSSGTVSTSIAGNFVKGVLSASGTFMVRIKGLKVGDRLKRFKWTGSSSGAPTITLYRQTANAGTLLIPTTVTPGTGILISGTEEHNVTSPVSLAAGQTLWIKVVNGAQDFDLQEIERVWDVI